MVTLVKRPKDCSEDELESFVNLVAEAGKTGVIIWKMRSPYVFVGGKLEIEGNAAKFSLSWDGKSWQEVGENPGQQTPADLGFLVAPVGGHVGTSAVAVRHEKTLIDASVWALP